MRTPLTSSPHLEERNNVLEGLVRYCMDEASMAADGLVGLDQIEWLDRVREDLESYRAALRWLLDRDRLAEASHIASSLFFFSDDPWTRGRGPRLV